MDLKMTKKAFYDKVYAGWLGKNIGGTLGGPLEGIMELLDVKTYTQSFVEPVENDDLDLQLVALHTLEQYGGNMSTQLLSREWLSHVHFQFDEYGHALTNLRRGLHPPLSGSFNNYFTDCMGSPIRSELWGMVCAGKPGLAAYFACQDAMVDHAGGEGVYGEIFFAVFESLAFTCDDIPFLMKRGLDYLPDSCRVSQAVTHLLDCWRNGLSWQENRSSLIQRFGSENFTDAPLNIAFTMMGLLYGEGFTQRLLISANCGYDTDCTCATVAAMMGILYGSAYLDKCWTEPLGENILVSPPVNGFPAPKDIGELSRRTVRARELVDSQFPDDWKGLLDFTCDVQQYYLPAGSVHEFDYACQLSFDSGAPVIAKGECRRLMLAVENYRTVTAHLTVQLEPGKGLAVLTPAQELILAPGEKGTAVITVQAKDKRAQYRGELSVTTMTGNLLWSTEQLAVTLLGTQDWVGESGGKVRTLHCPGSKISVPEDYWQMGFTVTTRLHLDRPSQVKLIVACPGGVQLKLGGLVLVDCDEYTPVIPAYHRSDLRKCAQLFLEKGKYPITITVKGTDQPGELFFYAVDPDENFANINTCVIGEL